MALATWWRGDTVPELSLLLGFRDEASRDTHLVADITRLVPGEVEQRMHSVTSRILPLTRRHRSAMAGWRHRRLR